MKKYLIVIFFFMSHISFGQTNETALVPTNRFQLMSNYLGEERTYQVYLPPSYYFSEKGNYPVVYLIDGDYSFYFDTGLIESMSNVSGKIPEMIVVGISDKGNAKYKINCTPTGASKKEGNATHFMEFIEKELKAEVNKKYRTSGYDILIGHSIGGLFVTNYFLEKPKDFDTYIAIDPSLWWGDYEIINRADSIFKDKKQLEARLFISLADTKMMGVQQFVGVLDKYFPMNEKWTFHHYQNENHGSVALVTIKDALLSLFEGWALSREQFYSFKNAGEVIGHYKKISKDFSTSFLLPPSFGDVIYFYSRKEKMDDLAMLESELKAHFPSSLDEFYIQEALNYIEHGENEKAQAIYTKRIKEAPLCFKCHEGLSKIYFEKKEYNQAKKESEKAIQIGKQVKVRQWQLNELVSNKEKIEQQMKK